MHRGVRLREAPASERFCLLAEGCYTQVGATRLPRKGKQSANLVTTQHFASWVDSASSRVSVKKKTMMNCCTALPSVNRVTMYRSQLETPPPPISYSLFKQTLPPKYHVTRRFPPPRYSSQLILSSFFDAFTLNTQCTQRECCSFLRNVELWRGEGTLAHRASLTSPMRRTNDPTEAIASLTSASFPNDLR